ncbi:hypothetical protein FE257_004878, partial [Aspergillus nanangensis]
MDGHPTARTPRACEPCREQKAKCSGDYPTCKRCHSAGACCFYGLTKRQMLDRKLLELENQVRTFRLLLRDIQPKLDAGLARRVEEALNNSTAIDEEYPDNKKLFVSPPDSTKSGPDPIGASYKCQEPSTGFTEEDFNRDIKSQATGFLGEHSGMLWLYRLGKELEQDHSVLGAVGSVSVGQQRTRWDSVTSVNYSVDDVDLPINWRIDVLQVPPRRIADILIDHYFRIVHPCFPIVSKALFTRQYGSFYSSPNVRPGKRWLAILNLIFATASRSPLPLPFEDEKVWGGEGDVQYGATHTKPLKLTGSSGAKESCQSVYRKKDIPANTSLYFLYFVELTLLMKETIESLYAPATANEPWLKLEATIISINARLDEWKLQLPSEFQFGNIEISQPYIRQQISLEFRFYSTKILLLQPCLRRSRKYATSDSSKSLADLCVESACLMLHLLPQLPDAAWLYNISPWWYRSNRRRRVAAKRTADELLFYRGMLNGLFRVIRAEDESLGSRLVQIIKNDTPMRQVREAIDEFLRLTAGTEEPEF